MPNAKEAYANIHFITYFIGNWLYHASRGNQYEKSPARGNDTGKNQGRGNSVHPVIDNTTLINRSCIHEFASESYCRDYGTTDEAVLIYR